MLTRHQILHTLQTALEPHNYVYAMWEGGSAAFGRADEWSDVDVQIVVEDERVSEAFAAAEAALLSLSPFEILW
ncbi:MAG: nucleotidyltransferase domain-containing protein [Anaerolineales bacterium]|nr:nucleotidyltransferase domain-containing protein [Anaerolineales bacterium]